MWKRLIKPLRSRKVRVALTTVIVAIAAEYGLNMSSEIVLTILGVGVSVILGIAVEDNGRNKAMLTMWPNVLPLAYKPPYKPKPGSTQHGLTDKPPAEPKS